MKEHKNNKVKLNVFIKIGLLFIGLSLVLSIIIFYPIIKEEIKYKLITKNSTATLNGYEYKESEIETVAPIDEGFSIIVPKIGANARVIQDVDPYNETEYQRSLSKGVAHAKGSALPGEVGNTFLFAHSSDNLLNANRYNSVFYLLNKLELQDIFVIVREGKTYKYKVTDKLIVSPEQVEYLENNVNKKQATLMTCWPAGTTINRLLIIGEQLE